MTDLETRLWALGPVGPDGSGGHSGACPQSDQSGSALLAELARCSLPQAAPPEPAPLSFAGGLATGRVSCADAARDAAGSPLVPGRAPIVCAIGAFDGVHRGHRALLARARKEAAARGALLVVVTFDPDPSAVLAPDRAADELLCASDRAATLWALGPDALVSLDFTPALSRVPHDRFVREVLGGLGSLRAIVVGADFRLGAGGAGTVAALAELGRADGFDVLGMELADDAGRPITATRVRHDVAEGAVERAAGLLGRCHVLRGRVAHGRGEGARFGFPTANVQVRDAACLPAEGVYAGFAAVGGRAWPTAVNVGRPRTFEPGAEGAPFLEATLVGFEGDLYGAEVAVGLARWLRGPRTFASLDELVRVVGGNVDWVRRALGETGVDLATGRACTGVGVAGGVAGEVAAAGPASARACTCTGEPATAGLATPARVCTCTGEPATPGRECTCTDESAFSPREPSTCGYTKTPENYSRECTCTGEPATSARECTCTGDPAAAGPVSARECTCTDEPGAAGPVSARECTCTGEPAADPAATAARLDTPASCGHDGAPRAGAPGAGAPGPDAARTEPAGGGRA